MTRGLIIALMLVVIPAAAQAEGINLSWDDCGTHGTCFKSFACNTNTGFPFVLIGSFVPPAGNTKITGEEVVIDVVNPGYDGPGPVSPIPDWWMFKNAGTCRRTALIGDIDFLGHDLVSCEDYWAPRGGAGGISAYQAPYAGMANRARLLLVFAVPPALATALDPGLEYYALRVAITRTNTVGTGACGGCTTRMQIMLTEVKLTQPVGVGDFRIQTPVVQNTAYWQDGQYYGCGYVPVRNSTWGAIKSQYR